MDRRKKEHEPKETGLRYENLPESHRKVLDQLDKMTSKQIFQTLIDSGIYTADGKLTKEYGG
jgi:hypothetical protein